MRDAKYVDESACCFTDKRIKCFTDVLYRDCVKSTNNADELVFQ